MSQTAYKLYQDIGYEGQIADTSVRDIFSRMAEADIEFGRALKKGTATGSCLTASASGDTIVGVSVRTQAVENDLTTGEAKYKNKDAVSVMTMGRIYAAPITAVDDGDDVYFVHATGKFSNAAGSSSTAGTKIEGWKWRSKATANGIAVLEVR